MYFPANSTAISLIPKVENPISLKQFRPISCCNVIYKVISKILVRRIQPLIPHLVNDNQAAFVKGRTIQNNILLMHEIVESYNRKGGPKCCAVKVNIMKAFDTVSWTYLDWILQNMNFPDEFIKWIELCITTTSFSINLNGSLNGHFKASRELRQGDPLSSSLFILITEGFNQILNIKASDPCFTFHRRCEQLKISSLIFADDLFILSKADSQSILKFQEALSEFQA